MHDDNTDLNLPEHLSCWIAEEPNNGMIAVTGVADDRMFQVKFDHLIGCRPGERELVERHTMMVIEHAPQMLELLRHMVVQVRAGGPIRIDTVRSLLAKLDENDPSRRPEYPPLNFGQRLDQARINGEISNEE
jgi:hypothetical protein